MIAVDSNVLVYAHRVETPKHQPALQWLTHLAEGPVPWGLPVFCLGEFFRVVTHRAVFDPPSTLDQALQAVNGLLESPSIRLLTPSSGHPQLLEDMLRAAQATGNLVFDAQIAAVCRENGVSRLLTDDRDFARFEAIEVVSLEQAPGTS
jgi:toxin-antitoxin system PIN domain toxin